MVPFHGSTLPWHHSVSTVLVRTVFRRYGGGVVWCGAARMKDLANDSGGSMGSVTFWGDQDTGAKFCFTLREADRRSWIEIRLDSGTSLEICWNVFLAWEGQVERSTQVPIRDPVRMDIFICRTFFEGLDVFDLMCGFISEGTSFN